MNVLGLIAEIRAIGQTGLKYAEDEHDAQCVRLERRLA